MKYIYIDGGARIGESIEILLDPRPELLGCDSYMFECNPNHIETLNHLKINDKKYNFIVKQEALWNENCEKDFFISNDVWGDLGCTLKPEKRESLDRDNPIKVKCIDFSQFLEKFDDCYIIVKLDVEGAEYEILEHLIKTGTINKINELYVEFHDNFFNTSSNNIKEKLNSLNIKCDFNWM
jgi:FkbM family methyltransferase